MSRHFFLLCRPFLILAIGMSIAPAYADSLYEESNYRSLTSDIKAFRVGDVVTVQVYESSSASSSTDTATQRKSNVDASVAVLNSTRLNGGSVGASSDFDGGGTTQRTNRLLATLTASVREVLPNGDLKIAGEQLLMVNNEKHKVSVEGRARPQDISAENILLSTRLADARISYAGDGDLSDRQRNAWWTQLLYWLGL